MDKNFESENTTINTFSRISNNTKELSSIEKILIKVIRRKKIFFITLLSFLVLGLINSKILSPLNNVWFKFGLFLGKVISPLIMMIIFFFNKKCWSKSFAVKVGNFNNFIDIETFYSVRVCSCN